MFGCVVWVDSEHARIFVLNPAGVEKKNLKKGTHKHSNSHQQEHKHQEEEHFFHELAQSLGNPEELLIVGPGMAKTHFKTHLEKHKHSQLTKVLVGVETMQDLSDNQILEGARKFFKKYHTFNPTL